VCLDVSERYSKRSQSVEVNLGRKGGGTRGMPEFKMCKPNLANREMVSLLQKVVVHLELSNSNECVTDGPRKCSEMMELQHKETTYSRGSRGHGGILATKWDSSITASGTRTVQLVRGAGINRMMRSCWNVLILKKGVSILC
jgi:hypothetical protein